MESLHRGRNPRSKESEAIVDSFSFPREASSKSYRINFSLLHTQTRGPSTIIGAFPSLPSLIKLCLASSERNVSY